MKLADRARVTTFVSIEPGEAFEVFTQDIDQWWKRGRRFRFGGQGILRFEGTLGGRLIETWPGSAKEFDVGRVLVWEPGARLVFEWRASNFDDGEVTEVEVRFEALNDGTQVTLEHRGFASLRPDHPVRHGLEGQAFTDMMGRWWGELAMSFRNYIADRG